MQSMPSYPAADLRGKLPGALARADDTHVQGTIARFLLRAKGGLRAGQPVGLFRKAWLRACREAGIPGRLFHDLRRTAVRNLEAAGVPRSAAMAMVAHKTESIHRRYAIADTALLKIGARGSARFPAIRMPSKTD